ncbi:hypothetical protein Lal_00044878, partial [Lupinus albus]
PRPSPRTASFAPSRRRARVEVDGRDPDPNPPQPPGAAVPPLGARHDRAHGGAGGDHDLPDDGLHRLHQPEHPRGSRDAEGRGLRRHLPRGGDRLGGDGLPGQLSHRPRAGHGAQRLFRLRRRAADGLHVAGGPRRGVHLRPVLPDRDADRPAPDHRGGHPALHAHRPHGGDRPVPGHHRLKNAGVVAASPATFVTLGDLHKPSTVLAVIGFLIVAVLSARRIKAALLTSILVVTGLSFVFAGNAFTGLVSLPPSWSRPSSPSICPPPSPAGSSTSSSSCSWPDGPARPGADGRFLGDLHRLAARHIQHDRLSRKRGRGGGGRAHRPHRRDGGPAVPGLPVLRAARRFRAALRHGTRPVLRRLPDAAGAGRPRLGRHHRGDPGLRDGTVDALHLLHRHRRFLRLHHLCRAEAPERPRPRGEAGRLGDRRPVPVQVRRDRRRALIRRIAMMTGERCGLRGRCRSAVPARHRVSGNDRP